LALVKAGRLDEALLYLEDVLRRRPSSGPANLGVADIDRQKGSTDDAAVHYQHAIYGSWPDHPVENRIRARMALVQLLKKAGRPEQARAELLELAADGPKDRAAEKQTGQMLIDFGLAKEAAALFASMLKRGPPDAAVYAGLGDAEFALANYTTARQAFQSALKIDPADAHAAGRAQLCERIHELDPAARGIPSAERLRRSRELLKTVLQRVPGCAGPESSWPAQLSEAVPAAREALARNPRRKPLAGESEADPALAAKVWAALPPACLAASGDDPAGRLLAREQAR
jgi:tetratricopeptide (TPR) repeat protein